MVHLQEGTEVCLRAAKKIIQDVNGNKVEPNNEMDAVLLKVRPIQSGKWSFYKTAKWVNCRAVFA